jgi:hypothetical protein
VCIYIFLEIDRQISTDSTMHKPLHRSLSTMLRLARLTRLAKGLVWLSFAHPLLPHGCFPRGPAENEAAEVHH